MRKVQWTIPALCVLTLVLAGCGDSTGGDGSVNGTVDANTGEPDLSEGDISGADTAAEDSGSADTGASADTSGADSAGADATTSDAGGENCPGGFGCPCSANDDCDSTLCIETPKGKICTVNCIEDCPSPDFKCVTTGGSDSGAICVSKYGNVCNPCNSNNECKTAGHDDARCIDGGDAGAFCGTGCTNNTDCLTGYECKEVTDVAGLKSNQCVPTNGACECSDAAIAQELSTTCYKAVGDAKCAGKRTCLADGKADAPPGGGLTACIAEVPDAETCDGKDNDCDGETDESTCDDNESCTIDACDPKSGCTNTNKNGPCDADGSVCTQNDVCKDGKCEAGETLNCDDKNPCTLDTCDPKDGCKYSNTQAPCNADDNECTVADSCKDGKCVAGDTKSCDPGKPCVSGSCSIIDGKCKYKVTDGFACNDGDQCTKDEKCSGETCSGQPVKCDDLDACTADSCDPTKGCVHVSVTGPCDDGNKCTDKDVCSSGKCQGVPADVKTKCDDNNACTTDLCDPSAGCQNKPLDGNACEDGNSCTQGDKCNKGVCQAGANKCACNSDADCKAKEDGNLCNGTLYCDKTGPTYECKVAPTTVVKCDTSKDDTCGSTICVPNTGKCVKQSKQDGLPCDADGSLCTLNDTCKGGSCVAGALVKCDDKNPCTNDACDPVKGCVTINNTAACDADGNACTVNDVCKAGTCVAGLKKICDDGESCTLDTCDTSTGKCTTKTLDQGCDDGSACTVGDKCGDDNGKWTCLSGAKKNCDDNNACTVDACDAKTGCSNKIAEGQAVPCYSGDPKTKDKGVCKSGTQTCKADGSATACTGEVTPAAKETCGDGKDNTCDGVVDEGCAPTGLVGRFSSAHVSGTSGKLKLRSSLGVSIGAGSAKGQGKYALEAGFYAWLKTLIK